MSIRLSVVMISKNASDLLLESLASISWADEIILLDAGSDDDTVEIALSMGAKVFTDSNWLGYGIQRQRAQSFATGDYILMIDTDEKVTPRLRQSIQTVLKNPKTEVVYSISRRNYFLGRFMRYGGYYPDRVIRLYERNRYQYNNDQVHESLSYGKAKIIHLDGDLLHFTCNDFSNFLRKQLNYALIWAQDRFQKGSKISFTDIFYHTLGTFLKTFLFRKGLLDSKQGLLLSIINAQYTFNKYAVLWALNQDCLKKVYKEND